MRYFHGDVISEVIVGPFAVVDARYAPEVPILLHEHDCAYVSALLEGRYTEVAHLVPQLSKTGAVIAHRRGEEHADIFHEPGRIINIEIESEHSIDRAVTLLDMWLDRSVEVPRSLVEPLKRAARTLGSKEAWSRQKPLWLERIIATFDWIEAVPLREAARSAGLHPTHFARAFRRHVGMTPGAYRRRERVRAASKRLLASTASISHIAYVTGFTDQSHFTHAFHAVAGMSPAAYRRAFWR